jgi:hypothetical protein
MTKPTGKPRGRPKTKEYATLMARIPQELADQVKQYAGLHRQSISVVIREGLLLLLESDSYGKFMSDRKEARAETHIVSDRKEKEPEIVYDTKEGDENMSDTKAAVQKIVSDKNEAAPETTSPSSGMPPFDATKYVLGKLCPRQHDYDGTGHSLLRLSNRHCLACDREKFHERKQAKRQAEAQRASSQQV